ncbi:undecaprenyl-phosphate glucose phosphotransferase [Pseudomonas sp. BT-42-2]|uniref:undecaprenyl-phosphate glucose phosphotransferase n=1 Tax=unclassified Pseudomonas TaxID=196821 RepID=UPI0021F6F1D0|nr:undecaprenyl-phosphate glucose phosphotransferase [Pseudomonas sp. BT-42-2]MCV9919515.1 undecaprenyl-phosphate glucose phosphotransferase [Pseudomonas sp. BT-42-2]
MQLKPKYQPTFAERYPVPLFFAITDILLVFASGLAAFFYRFHNVDLPAKYSLALGTTAIVVVICLALGGAYGSQRGYSFWRQLSLLIACWASAAGMLLSVSFFLKVSEDYSRIWFSTTIITGGFLCVMLRLVVYVLLRKIRNSGMNLKSVLVIYSTDSTETQFNTNENLKEDGFIIVAKVKFDVGQEWTENLIAQIEELKIHEVWLSLPLSEGGRVRSVMYALRHHTVAIRFIPELGDIRLLNHRVSYIAGLYSLDLSCSPMDSPARVIKRLEDLVIGSIISLCILPLCIVIAIAIRTTSPGPILFKQHRTGINGKKFKVYKFRSMHLHDDCRVTQASRNDSRITKVGAFLRRTSLDELPQFFNVLQGRMSIVGPRPHALTHNEYYKDLVESYMQRHKVKPGITGWAQVSGYRGETDTLEKMQKRVEHDLWYIDNWSLWIDLKIIFLTMYKGFIHKNAF